MAKKKKKVLHKKKSEQSAKKKQSSANVKKTKKPAAKKIKEEPQQAPQKLFNIQKVSRKKWFKTKLSKDFRTPIIIVFGLLALFIIYQISSAVITYALIGKALPGTRVAGIEVGTLSLDEIQERLMEKGQPFLEKPIQIKLGEESREFLPSELGISLLPRYSLQEIHFVKFENTNLITILGSLWGGHEIPFYVSVDVNFAAANIESRFDFGGQKAKNAYLSFDEEGELIIVAEKEGEDIDLRQLYQDIKLRANQLSSDPISVTTGHRKPLVTQALLGERLEEIKEILNKTITLTYDYWDFDIRLIDHVDWITFDYKNTLHIGDQLSLPLDLSEESAGPLPSSLSLEQQLWINIGYGPFLAYVEEEIAPGVEIETQDVNIYKDENDEIIIEGKGENGREIKRKYFATALELAANYGFGEVGIPVFEKKAHAEISDDLKMLGIETLIGTGRSAFAGSPVNRIHNIGVGVSKFNGVLIKPGEEFSFNEQLGPVDASTGYRPELVIKAEGTIPEYGGGLCQVSSTMYRAALLAGLPITERAPHSYAVSYYAQIYGYGLDATIYPGVRDIKFINDTPGHILVQSYTEGTQAYFKFYGTDDGRSVEMEGPYLGNYHGPGPATLIESSSLAPGQTRQVEYGHTGFNATWYRYLTKGGETIKETIFSAYKAIPAKILVGPGDGE